jgi:O-antigen/teichoic acid export membrane protein
MEFNRSVLLEYTQERLPAPTEATLGIARTQIIAAFAIPAGVGIGTAIFGALIFPVSYRAALPVAATLLIGQVFYGLFVVPMNYIVQTAGKFKLSSLPPVLGAAISAIGILLGGATGSLQVAASGTSAGFFAMAAFTVALVRFENIQLHWKMLVPPASQAVPAMLAATASVTALLLFAHPARFYGSFAGAIFLCLTGTAMYGQLRRANRLPLGARPR